MTASLAISDLRDRPASRAPSPAVCGGHGGSRRVHPLALVEGLVVRDLGPGPIPFALVAHEGDAFLGTVSGIADDLGARPRYTPWVAALRVDPGHRARGVGAALLRACADRILGLRHPRAPLCATPHRHGFSEGRGWRVIERDVEEGGLAAFAYP